MDKIIQYCKDNPILVIILAALLVAVIVIIVVIAVHSSRKKRKAKEAALKAENAAVPPAQPAPVNREQLSAQPDSISTAPAADPAEDEPVQEEDIESMPEQPDTQAQPAISEADEEVPATPVQPAEPREKPAPAKTRSAVKAQKTQPNTNAAEQAAPQAVVHADADESKAEEDKKYAGKWVICKNEENDTYYFTLLASNGEKLLESIEYTSLTGAKNGIKTHKNNILKGNIVISRSKSNQYYFKLLNGSKQLLCTGETYKTRTNCENAVESVKRFAETAVVSVDVDKENS